MGATPIVGTRFLKWHSSQKQKVVGKLHTDLFLILYIAPIYCSYSKKWIIVQEVYDRFIKENLKEVYGLKIWSYFKFSRCTTYMVVVVHLLWRLRSWQFSYLIGRMPPQQLYDLRGHTPA